jgi:hypothetical protein
LSEEKKAKLAFDLATSTLRAEGFSSEGRVNLYGLFIVFLLVVGAGLLDLIQVIVRIFRPGYETGLPSLFEFVALYVFLILACLIILACASRSVNTPADRD